MSDELRRLLDEGPSAELRAALESGLRDQPSPRTLGRAAQALGVGAAGFGAARAAAAALHSGALRTPLWGALAKWGGVVVLLGGVAISPVVLNAPAAPRAKVMQRSKPGVSASLSKLNLAEPPQRAEPSAVVSTARSALPATTPVRVPSAAVQRPVRDAHAVAPGPTLPIAPTIATASQNAPPKARAPLIDSEITLLDAARTALKRNDPSAALILLDRHTQLGAGSLGAEATLLRVQALVGSGRFAEARAVARAALSNSNGRPYAARLRKVAQLDE